MRIIQDPGTSRLGVSGIVTASDSASTMPKRLHAYIVEGRDDLCSLALAFAQPLFRDLCLTSNSNIGAVPKFGKVRRAGDGTRTGLRSGLGKGELAHLNQTSLLGIVRTEAENDPQIFKRRSGIANR